MCALFENFDYIVLVIAELADGVENLPFLMAASLHDTISTSQVLPVQPGAHRQR